MTLEDGDESRDRGERENGHVDAKWRIHSAGGHQEAEKSCDEQRQAQADLCRRHVHR
jgi:hypothetical protein